jgi:hypothetical protein
MILTSFLEGNEKCLKYDKELGQLISGCSNITICWRGASKSFLESILVPTAQIGALLD